MYRVSKEREREREKKSCHGIGGTGGNQKVIKQNWRGEEDKGGEGEE